MCCISTTERNYDGLRQELDIPCNWDAEFKNKPTTECWEIFKARVDAALSNHVPKTRPNSHIAKMRPKWMSFRALTKVNKKHKYWQRFISSKSESDYEENAKARNQAKNEIRK